MTDEELQSKLELLQKTTFQSDDYDPQMGSTFQVMKRELLAAISKETGIDDEDFLAAPITNRMLNKDRCLFFLNCFVKFVDGSASYIIEKSTSGYQDNEQIKNLQTENQTLKSETIIDKKTIIELQEKVIVQTENKLHDIQNTVQSEMKSFSSIVKDTCSAALAPSKIETVIKKVKLEDSRDRNVIVYGVPEEPEEDLRREASAVFEDIGEQPRVVSCSRLGTTREGSIRPIKCCMSSTAHVIQILRNASKLKESDRFKTVYLSPDRTAEERNKRRQLVEQWKQKKIENPDTDYRIDFRKNEICKVKHNI